MLARVRKDRLHRQLGGVAGLLAGDLVGHRDGGAVVEVADLDGLSISTAGPIDTISLSAGSSYRGESAILSNPGRLEMLVDLHFQAAANGQSFSFDIGSAGENLGISLTGSISVDASIDANLSIGISTDATPVVFLKPGGTVNLDVDATAHEGTDLRLAPLDLGCRG